MGLANIPVSLNQADRICRRLDPTLPGGGYGGDDVFTIPEHAPIPPGQDLPDALQRRADPGYSHDVTIGRAGLLNAGIKPLLPSPKQRTQMLLEFDLRQFPT
jgi:hypothetical protein